MPKWKPELSLGRGMEQIFAWWEEEGFPADPQKEHLEDQLCELAERFEGEVKLRFS